MFDTCSKYDTTTINHLTICQSFFILHPLAIWRRLSTPSTNLYPRHKARIPCHTITFVYLILLMSQQSHYSSSKDEGRSSEDRRLPPIRDLFRALEESQQMPPSSAQGYGRNPKSQHTVNLPPFSGRGHADGPSYYDSSSHLRARSSSLSGPHAGYSVSDNRHGGSSSTNRTGDRTLPTPASSKLSSTYIPPEDFDPDKRYKCDYCGKRFDRPSSLQVHIRTHTGAQPYTCEWPGCARTFNVKSNMLRHWRSHERSDLGPNGQELGSFPPSEPHQADQRGAWTSAGQESLGSSGGSFSHPPTRSTGYYS